MWVYDEDLGEMVEDNRKTYECPKCDTYWTNEEGLRKLVKCDEDPEFETWPKDKELKSLTILNVDDGVEIPYRKYIEKLCPDCNEKTIDGRLKGPLVWVDLEGKELDYRELKCQVCGSEDIEFNETTDIPDGIVTCNNCNSYHFIDTENVYFSGVVIRNKVKYLSYREDLQTKKFNQYFPECVDILQSEGTLIKKDDENVVERK